MILWALRCIKLKIFWIWLYFLNEDAESLLVPRGTGGGGNFFILGQNQQNLSIEVGRIILTSCPGSGRMNLMLPGSPYEPLSADHLHKPGSHQQTHCSLSDSQMHKLFHFRQSFFYQTSFEHKHWPKVTFSPQNWGRIGQGEVSKSLKQNQCRLR